MNELKAKCDAIEKREAERRTIEEKKHAEEIQFLKRTNQQLKVQYSLVNSQFPVETNFLSWQKKYIPGKSILKLVKLQSLVTKCCKMRKI